MNDLMKLFLGFAFMGRQRADNTRYTKLKCGIVIANVVILPADTFIC